MDPFSMVVAIVAISVGAGVINNRSKLKAKYARNDSQDAEIHAMRADVDRLSERVRVLEKLVTDQDRQLADEIRRLA